MPYIGFIVQMVTQDQTERPPILLFFCAAYVTSYQCLLLLFYSVLRRHNFCVPGARQFRVTELNLIQGAYWPDEIPGNIPVSSLLTTCIRHSTSVPHESLVKKWWAKKEDHLIFLEIGRAPTHYFPVSKSDSIRAWSHY